MKYLAILRDSMRETLDRKSLYFLLAVSTLIIFVVACIGFEQVDVHETVSSMVNGFKNDSRLYGLEYQVRQFDVDFKVTDTRTVSGAEAGEFDGGVAFNLAASPLFEFQKLVLFHDAASEGDLKNAHDPIPGLSKDQTKVEDAPSDEEMSDFLKAKFAEVNLNRVRIEPQGTEGGIARFNVTFKPSRRDTLIAGHRLSIFFGKWKFPLRDMSVGDVVFWIQGKLAYFFAGWAGLLVAIVATASFIPNMLQKGTLDLLLSRPIHRPTLLIYKYLGGLTYVLFNAIYLIGGSWLVLAVRSGIWSPGFLLTIPLLVFFFAALYSVSTLFGVLTRNSVVGIMTAVICWFGLFLIGSMNDFINMPGIDPPKWLHSTVGFLHSTFPPLDLMDKAVERTLATANGITPERYRKVYLQPMPEVSWGKLFGVTGAWMIALMGLACWRFSTKDY